jgi:hypothetical protein
LKIGILAYGSLIDDPGPDIDPNIEITLLDIHTPFRVEFARSSQSRGGAPTLVAVDSGGACVKAVIHAMKSGIDVEQAQDWVWRREVRKYGAKDHYFRKSHRGKNTVTVEAISGLGGIETVLYASIPANIEPLNAEELARRAVESAQKPTVKAGRDGISYLINAKRQGIVTPLATGYEEAILQMTSTSSLQDALELCRRAGGGFTVADREAAVTAFCEDCIWARAVRTHFTDLFESGENRLALLRETANTFFHDLNIILLEYVLLVQHKLIDDASSGAEKHNLTSNYILSLEWSDETRSKLATENNLLQQFRAKITDARSKLIAHTDLRARLEPIALGSFVEADEQAFWAALQRFVDAAHEEAIGGPCE